MPYTAEKQTCNKDITVLLFPANNTMTRGKIILRIIAYWPGITKQCYPCFMRVFLLILRVVCALFTRGREEKISRWKIATCNAK